MKTLPCVAAGLFAASPLCYSGPKDTANYVQSAIEKFDGTTGQVDVTHLVRINLALAGSNVALFSAHTIDDRSRTFGGKILVIADNSAIADLIKKYGTSVDQSSRRVTAKSLKGTVGRIRNEGMEDIVFINISSDPHPEKLPLKRVSVDAVVTPEKTQ